MIEGAERRKRMKEKHKEKLFAGLLGRNGGD